MRQGVTCVEVPTQTVPQVLRQGPHVALRRGLRQVGPDPRPDAVRNHGCEVLGGDAVEGVWRVYGEVPWVCRGGHGQGRREAHVDHWLREDGGVGGEGKVPRGVEVDACEGGDDEHLIEGLVRDNGEGEVEVACLVEVGRTVIQAVHYVDM